MFDRERIGTIVGDIDEFLSKIEKLNVNTVGDLRTDWRNFHTAAILIFGIVNRCIDLAEEVIVSRNLGIPTTYREHFYLLYENAIINEELYEKLSSLVKIRNLIAHEYYRFKMDDIFEALQNISYLFS